MEADQDYFSNIIAMKNLTKEPVTKWQLVIKRDKNGLGERKENDTKWKLAAMQS